MIVVEYASNITVTPHMRPGWHEAPCICHLVNRNYEPARDEVVPQTEFSVHISDRLFGTPIKEAEIFSPNSESIRLEVKCQGGRSEVAVPLLEQWGILKLQLSDQ